MTPAGQQAMTIARWAWDDPAGRVQTAIEQVRGMASTADGQELREIQDAGTMLHRLAGTLNEADTEPVAGEDTILQQLAGDTITSQLVDLANEAWRTEKRGRGGKWTSGPAGAIERTAKGAERIKRIQARQQRDTASASAAKPGANKAEAVLHEVKGQSPETRQLLADLKPLIDQEVAKALAANTVVPQHVMSAAEKAVDIKLAEARTLEAKHEATHEARKAKLKLATEASLAVTGGLLAYLAAKMGAPDIAAIAATVGPFLIQTIIEFFKRL